MVIGAGLSAGDVAFMVDEINRVQPRWKLLGFLDDDVSKHGQSIAGYPVLGAISAAGDFRNCRFVVCMAHYRRRLIRKVIVERMGLPLDRFATLIHPRAVVPPTATIGAGMIVFENSVIHYAAALGNHVYIGSLSLVGHNAVVEDYATMAPRSSLCGSTRLCTGAYAGAGSIVKDGITIGEGALVGIGAVVIRDVNQDEFVFGNPARVVSKAHK